MEVPVGRTCGAFVIRLVARGRDWIADRTTDEVTAGAHSRADIDSALRRDQAPVASAGEIRNAEREASPKGVPPALSPLAVEAWSPRTQQLMAAGHGYGVESPRELFERWATAKDRGGSDPSGALLGKTMMNIWNNSTARALFDHACLRRCSTDRREKKT